jgi:hypothetical protein
MGEKYFVIENRNIGFPGMPKFSETVLFSSEDRKECERFADEQRKQYNNRTMADCFVRSQSEAEKIRRYKEI